MTELVGITGLMGHGKDSVAWVLMTKYGFARYRLATKVYAFAYAIDPLVQADGEVVRLQSLVDRHGWEHAKRNYPDVRRILQRIGNEGRTVFGKWFWVNQLLTSIPDSIPKAVVPDVRYLNEAAAFDKVIRVVRPEPHTDRIVAENLSHISETEQDQIYADATIINDGTLEDLTVKVMEIPWLR